MKAMGLGTLFMRGGGGPGRGLTVQDGKVGLPGYGGHPLHDSGPGFGDPGGGVLRLRPADGAPGIWLKAKADRKGDSQFVQGFVTASLVVCVGAMAIVGSIQDGLTGNATTLYTKAVIDGIVVMVMASVYGKGVLFAALPVGVLQGAITLCAGLLAPVFSQPVIDNLSFLGSLLIFCVGVNLAFGTKFKVANMLPALVFGVVFTLVVPYLPL